MWLWDDWLYGLGNHVGLDGIRVYLSKLIHFLVL